MYRDDGMPPGMYAPYQVKLKKNCKILINIHDIHPNFSQKSIFFHTKFLKFRIRLDDGRGCIFVPHDDDKVIRLVK